MRPHVHSSRSSAFARFANRVSRWMGHPVAFLMAAALVAGWLISGPLCGFSDSWQLIINTATSVTTFLMVFLIQNTQHRDAQAMQLKLDEIIRSLDGAHLALLDLEELSDSGIAAAHERYVKLAKRARERMRRGEADTGTPEIGSDMRL